MFPACFQEQRTGHPNKKSTFCCNHILFKDTEYGLDNPANNYKRELYETYQYVATKHNYQDSAQKEKHVSRLLKSSAYSLYSVSAVSVVILLYDYWGIIIKQFGRLLMLSNILFHQFSSVTCTCLPVLSMLIHSPFSLTSAVFVPNKKP